MTRTAASPRAIAPLDTLPLFHRLAGRAVMVVGQGDAVRWKIDLLLAAGADVRWFGAGLYPVAAERLDIRSGEWTEADLAGVALAVGAGGPEGAALAVAARARGVPVNVVDEAERSDFIFGTIVNRSPVVIGIGTGGAAPVLGQRLRERIEGLVGPGLAGWAAAAREWRGRLKQDVGEFAARRAFWRAFADRAIGATIAPGDGDYASILAESGGSLPPAKILFVGAGPGDPSHLTLGGLRALQHATVILHDDLVSDEVLELARREARRVRVGKRAGQPSMAQADINQLLLHHAQPGETVVRLKGGDPTLFSRLAEEIDVCRGAGIGYVIVPGISAAQAGAAALGVPLTARGASQRLQYVTGQGANGRLPDDLNWAAIADPAATTALYMGRRTLGEFAARAITAGLDPATPAAALAGIGARKQVQVRTTLAGLKMGLAGLEMGLAGVDPALPLLVLIGEVTRQAMAELALEVAA